MGFHLESIWMIMFSQSVATLLLLSLLILIINAYEMGGRLNRMGKLLWRFGMVLVYIHAGTWTLSVVNSSSMAFTMGATRIIAVFMFVESSFYPILILLTTIPPLIKSLMSSYTRVSSPPLLDLLCILTDPMLREQWKRKRGPAWYSFIVRHTCPSLLDASSHHLIVVVSPSTALNRDGNDWGPIFVVEKITPARPEPIDASTTVTPMNAQNILAPSVQVDDNCPAQKPHEYWGFPVLEEVALMSVEEEIQKSADLNIVVFQKVLV